MPLGNLQMIPIPTKCSACQRPMIVTAADDCPNEWAVKLASLLTCDVCLGREAYTTKPTNVLQLPNQDEAEGFVDAPARLPAGIKGISLSDEPNGFTRQTKHLV